MRIGFLVNQIPTEVPQYTTTLLAHEAVTRGHEAYYLDVGQFSYRPDERLVLGARAAPPGRYADPFAYLDAVQGPLAEEVALDVRDLDVLFLRNDPAQDAGERPWAQYVGIQFGQQAVARGVLVLNDPSGLSHALDKLYFQSFPPEIRPNSLITRDPAEIRAFLLEEERSIVLKPLQGSGGRSVFHVRREERDNLNQMIEAVSRDGYVVAQEYLPLAAEGDIRFFLLNGEPLRDGDRYAVLRRIAAEGDLRSNMHRGGRAERAEVTDDMLRIADLVRPKLVQDGLYLVGLDIVGDKVLEINVFSPGGLHSANETQGASFPRVILEDLERKIRLARWNRPENAVLATL